MQITPEIRQAVYDADCAELGHIYDFDNIMTNDAPEHSASDEAKMPFIKCYRCGRVWLIIPVTGTNYEEAERHLYGFLHANTDVARLIARLRGKRENRPDRNPLGRAVH